MVYDVKFLARRNDWTPNISLYIVDDSGEKLYTAKSIEMQERVEGADVSPAITVSPHTAQMLMDSLWDCGLRPSEGTGSAGQLAATQKHLEDMRHIVLHQLGITA